MQTEKVFERGYELSGAMLMEECTSNPERKPSECGQDGAAAEVEEENAEGCEWNLSVLFAFEQMPWDVSTEAKPKNLGAVSVFRSKVGVFGGDEYTSDVPTMCVYERDIYADAADVDEAEGEKLLGTFVDVGDQYETVGDDDVDPETGAEQVKFISMLVDYAAKKMLMSNPERNPSPVRCWEINIPIFEKS